MLKSKKPTQSEIDGVQYRRAKLWQIILWACNALGGMAVYSLIGMASYSASIGYGISTAIVGVILTGTRILDAVTDPLLAFVYDKVNTRWGKIRILMVSGFLVEALALFAMFHLLSSKGFGLITFTLLYIVYILGYTVINMTIQTVPALMSNDPKQRPVIGVWQTVINYLVPVALSIGLNVILLPLCGGTYNQTFLSAAVKICLGLGLVGLIFACIGVSAFDKPENFRGISKKHEPLKLRDMADVLMHNRPLQSYIISAASDKIAQQVASQSIIVTMLNGILIGNMGLATILSTIGMLPSIVFAIIGAKYAGKHGSKKTIVTWTGICTIFAVIMIIFLTAINPAEIAVMGPVMIIYVLLTFALNGSKMCVTTANSAFMADIIDFELDRSGKYIPAVVTGTYSLLDKLISSFGALIATSAVAMLGYTSTMPQPGDARTPAIFWMTIFLCFVLPILGWLCTLIAMRFCKLDKAEMVNVQKRIAEKKTALQKEFFEKNLQ